MDCRFRRTRNRNRLQRLFDDDDIARGSALECAASLDVLRSKGRCSEEAILPGKDRLWSIVSMWVALTDCGRHDGNEAQAITITITITI